MSECITDITRPSALKAGMMLKVSSSQPSSFSEPRNPLRGNLDPGSRMLAPAWPAPRGPAHTPCHRLAMPKQCKTPYRPPGPGGNPAGSHLSRPPAKLFKCGTGTEDKALGQKGNYVRKCFSFLDSFFLNSLKYTKGDVFESKRQVWSRGRGKHTSLFFWLTSGQVPGAVAGRGHGSGCTALPACLLQLPGLPQGARFCGYLAFSRAPQQLLQGSQGAPSSSVHVIAPQC